jgi:hypothetical protein
MLLEVILYGSAGVAATAVFQRLAPPDISRLKKFIPSRTFRGSPEDLDPNEVVFNLVVTRMLRNIDKVQLTNSSIKYSDDKVVKFSFGTYGYFSSPDWLTSSYDVTIDLDESTLTIRNAGRKYPEALNKVVQLKQLRAQQLAKEEANEKAFKLIEALTDAKPEPEPSIYEQAVTR